MMMDLASTLPHRISQVVTLDGSPSRRSWPDIADHQRTKLLAGDLATWLDVRRSTVDAVRKPGTIDELAERRGRMNPRLSKDWLRYLVAVGGRHDPDGWRWKIDPTMRMGGFGPWRPEWAMERLSALGMPVLAVLGLEPEPMGWGTQASDVEPHLPPGGRVEELDDVGHFVHIEQPERVAAMVLDFLGEAPSARTRKPTVTIRHNRVDLALHRLREGDGRVLLHLHGLGERSPATVPAHLEAWTGPVWALDFTGHGASTVPRGGGYFAEVLMGDVDVALSHLGEVTIYGRGLGAYVGLLIAGARAEIVRGAILDDGPGLYGGSAGPASSFVLTEPFTASPVPPGSPQASTPDPYALLELAHDVRPPDYATTFARLAATQSGLEVAVAVVGAVRPPWLAAVAQEPGVQVIGRDRALALFG